MSSQSIVWLLLLLLHFTWAVDYLIPVRAIPPSRCPLLLCRLQHWIRAAIQSSRSRSNNNSNTLVVVQAFPWLSPSMKWTSSSNNSSLTSSITTASTTTIWPLHRHLPHRPAAWLHQLDLNWIWRPLVLHLLLPPPNSLTPDLVALHSMAATQNVTNCRSSNSNNKWKSHTTALRPWTVSLWTA